MKIVTVIGARPQFIKAATVSRAIVRHNETAGAVGIEECIVHTGQHYDENMSQVFFDELCIPRPDFNLQISGGGHGRMTGRMLEGIEQILLDIKPSWVLVYGDTNSTLAAALAAVKLHIPVAHVEAGLRSFNMRMPEEINRIVTDRVSSLLFCPTATAVANLQKEGIETGVHNVGDVMYDASLFYRDLAEKRVGLLSRYGLRPQQYLLATFHRAENTDDRVRLEAILNGLDRIARAGSPVILPLHPRTRAAIERADLLKLTATLICIEPASFLDMACLEQYARIIATDSGGVQKEAYFYGVPCITMRDETEWVETVEAGANVLAGANCERIFACCMKMADRNRDASFTPGHYGDGSAAHRVVELLNSAASRATDC